MTISKCLVKVVGGEDLTEEEAYQSMMDIMKGEATHAQTASFLTALSIKGETVTEITGFVRAMRESSLKVHSTKNPLVDTCGTGGDTLKTFNVSTAAAIIAASCGVTIAKHGNRSITSKCGGADILEAVGVNINCNDQEVEYCLENAGIGFMFAPVFHPAMKNVAPVRNELGIRTVFNILGPLTSPANADMQLLGVFDPDLVEPLAHVLNNLDVERAMVVHGFDSEGNPAMDEISTVGKTKVALLHEGSVDLLELYPEDFGIEKADEEHIIAPDTLEENMEIFHRVLRGKIASPADEARFNLCLVNAAAILYIAGKADSFTKGMDVALKAIEDGEALRQLDKFIVASQKG